MYEELTPHHGPLARGNGTQHQENVDFPSKITAEMLRKDLESELKLDSSDIRSYAWYHGKLPRDVTEELTKNDGDFLIRESVTNPGEYVLSVRWLGPVLHFKINQSVHQQGALQAKLQYQFEREAFDSIPALVMFHFGKSIPISLNTGAVIRRPINRTVPLSFSDAKYSSLRRQPRSQNGSVKTAQPAAYMHSTSLSSSSLSSESSSTAADALDPRLHIHHQYRPNVSPDHLQRHTTDLLPVVPPSVSPRAHLDYPNSPRSPMAGPNSPMARGTASRASLPKPFPLNIPEGHPNQAMMTVPSSGQRPLSQVEVNVQNHGKPVGRAGSEPQLSPTKSKAPPVDGIGPLPGLSRGAPSRGSATRTDGSPGAASVPPKPSRVPSFRRPVIRHRNSRSAENTPLSNIENKQSARLKKQANVSDLPNKLSVSTSKGGSISEPNTPLNTQQQAEERRKTAIDKPARSSGGEGGVAPSQHPNPASVRTSSSAASLLKGSDDARRASVNKSALPSAFNIHQFKSLLLPNENKPVDVGAMTVVKVSLLKTDPFKLARHMTAVDCKVCQVEQDGLEIIFLPKGAQLRKDIMERFQCVAFWVAVCVLRGCSTPEEQVDMLNVFIQIANELVHSLGNVFGFSALMAGLTCPQLRSIRELWSSLQQRYTNNAVTLEKKLRPLLNFLDEGRGQINLVSSCIPHIMPIIRYYENPLPGIPHISSGAKQPAVKQLSASEGDLLGSVASGGSGSSDREWWQNLPDDSFDSLMAQLLAARTQLTSLSKFRKNAKSKLQDFVTVPKLEEIFATEFHLRLLWGFKGAEVERTERYQKFDRFITLMAKRLSG